MGDEHILPNSAVCVANGYLLVASDFDYLRQLLLADAQSERLVHSGDYQQTWEAIRQLTQSEMGAWWFSRTEESVRPTYELLRQGRMPESKTMLGRVLNELLTTEVEEEEGQLRKQKVDASKLPDFETVRRYFGPSGRVIHSDPDGWFVTGATLNKSTAPVVASSERRGAARTGEN
jgi:hypothetical protein